MQAHSALWPLLVAAAAANGWLLTAAYAFGLGLPVRELDVDVTDYIVVASSVLAVWLLTLVIMVITRHRESRRVSLMGRFLSGVVLATMIAPTLITALLLGVAVTLLKVVEPITDRVFNWVLAVPRARHLAGWRPQFLSLW